MKCVGCVPCGAAAATMEAWCVEPEAMLIKVGDEVCWRPNRGRSGLSL